MAVATRFCGRCGRPNPATAPFCGNCGNPLAGPPVAAVVAVSLKKNNYAAPPHNYPVAPRGTVPAASGKLPFILLAGGVALVIGLAVIFISIFALVRLASSPEQKPCLRNCGPQIGTRLPEPATYHSSQYGYDVDYESDWKAMTQEKDNLVVASNIGQLQVVGFKAGKSDAQQVADFAAGLPTASWQGVHAVGDIKGAHIGHVAAAGTLYEANFITSNGRALRVRFAVIAATRNGVSVVVLAVDPADTQNYVSGIPEGGRFDYVLSEFRWAGQQY